MFLPDNGHKINKHMLAVMQYLLIIQEIIINSISSNDSKNFICVCVGTLNEIYFHLLGIWPLRLKTTAKNFDDALLLSFVGQSR